MLKVPPFESLTQCIQGDVLADETSRRLYATDASPYQQLPAAIARPRHRADCVAIVEFCARHNLPLIPRAAGTSLAGQCVGEGLIVDTARYMTAILDVNATARQARVEPGVVLADLNDELRSSGLMFAPDPSTADRCTVAGMAGNNAWGSHALRYGTTRDYVREVEVVLSDASVARFAPMDPDALARKMSLETQEGEIYRWLWQVVDLHRARILAAFPADVQCNTGYALDLLGKGGPWNERGPDFNLAPFLCGTEGTLALITELTLDLTPSPARRRLVCAHFHHLQEAMRAVAPAIEQEPDAVELLDRYILARTRDNLAQRRNRYWLEGDPGAVLMIEFQDEDAAVLDKKIRLLINRLRERNRGYAFPVLTDAALESAWALRKAGLGMLMGLPGPARPVSGIEDGAVPVARLAEYAQRVEALMAEYEVECVFYGSVGKGLLHLRPLLDLSSEVGRETFTALMASVAKAVAELGGSFSSKHGDGRLRGNYIEFTLGKSMVELMSEIKAAFDPHGLFNPRKLFDSPPVTEDLRDVPAPLAAVPQWFDWGEDKTLLGAARRCNGAGVCLKRAGRGSTMCPSYMATREERDVTRGRANILRQMAGASDPLASLAGPEVAEVLELCLSCKGCKAECPAGVDVAQMKAEALQLRHDRNGIPWRARWLGRFEHLCRAGSIAPALTNRVLASSRVKRRLGLHTERRLPRFARQTLSARMKHHRPCMHAGSRGEVVLLTDPLTEYFDPDTGIAAVEVLEAAGFSVRPVYLALGRVQISQGLLRRARRILDHAVQTLYPFARRGLSIVGVEPSELLTLRDEAPDLLSGGRRDEALIVASKALLFEEFISRQEEEQGKLRRALRPLDRPILLHGHCHQKALTGLDPVLAALHLIPDARIDVIPAGCCGMAGAFGYERDHYTLSMAIAELVLFPAIRVRGDAVIAATGHSCRQQITTGLNIEAFHPAGILHSVLTKNPI